MSVGRVVSSRSLLRLGLLVAALGAWLPGALWAQATDTERFAREPPDQIVTAEACGECHRSEYEVLQQTAHAEQFKTLHRTEAAPLIAGKLGYRLIKRDSLCLRCHYTPVVEDGELRAVSGVSCESCHGAAANWIKVHNDYGPDADRSTETPEHKQQRIERSRRAGMRRPSTDLYALAATCFQCHVVAEEELVNVGGHTTGSADFELVAWTEGKMRHNFLGAQIGGSPENAERPQSYKRVLYVLGRALGLEYALRAAAAANGNGVYAKAAIRRVRNALADVQDIVATAPIQEVSAMTEAMEGVRVAIGEGPALLAAADGVAAAARQAVEHLDGNRLAALDPLLRGEIPERVAEAAPEGSPPSGGEAVAAATAATSAHQAAGQPAAPGAAAPGYQRKTRLRPRDGDHQTIDAGACTGCHTPQNQWWLGDPHYAAADPFHEGNSKNVQIARLYGLKPSETTRGTQLCMDCHGTVVSGRESREIWDGVSCQSCHGPAADYLKPHEAGDKTEGTERQGYIDGLRLGMTELRDVDVRVATCASCHYVTDPGLLSTGHPSGSQFDIATRMPKVRHWDLPPESPAALTAAWNRVVARRGPVPEVRLAQLPADAPPGAAVAGTGASAVNGSGAVRAAPPRPRPVDPIAVPDPEHVRPLDLPPFPQIDADASVEEILRLIQQRLELLYRAVEEE